MIDSRWDEYKKRITGPDGPLQPQQSARVNELWNQLAAASNLPRAPHAVVTEDSVFAMEWDDTGRHHFEIEVFADGAYDWFYMDYRGTERASAEQQRTGATPQMIERFARAAT